LQQIEHQVANLVLRAVRTSNDATAAACDETNVPFKDLHYIAEMYWKMVPPEGLEPPTL
jgi:hypothetical protein